MVSISIAQSSLSSFNNNTGRICHAFERSLLSRKVGEALLGIYRALQSASRPKTQSLAKLEAVKGGSF